MPEDELWMITYIREEKKESHSIQFNFNLICFTQIVKVTVYEVHIFINIYKCR